MPEPFLKSAHLAGQVTDTNRAVANQPCHQHDRQTRTQAEHHRHEPAPRGRQGERDIDHGQEIY